MIATNPTTAKPPEAKPSGKKARRPQGPRLKKTPSREARRMATCILEVMGGTRTPTEAAQELGMPVPRYYLVEARALQGLVDACEPRPKGRVRSVQNELASAKKEAVWWRRECARYSALVRAAQRTIGVAPPPPRSKAKAAGKGKGPRKPTVRALKAVARLKEGAEEASSVVVQAQA